MKGSHVVVSSTSDSSGTSSNDEEILLKTVDKVCLIPGYRQQSKTKYYCWCVLLVCTTGALPIRPSANPVYSFFEACHQSKP